MKYDTNLKSIEQRTSNNNKNEISTKGVLIFMGVAIAIILIIKILTGDSPTNYYDNDFNSDGKVDEVDKANLERYMERVKENQK